MRPLEFASSPHRAHAAPSHGIANFLTTAWRRFRQQRRRRATMHILYKLDDRSLKDIGLTRSEIEPAVHGLPSRGTHRYIDLYGITPRG